MCKYLRKSNCITWVHLVRLFKESNRTIFYQNCIYRELGENQAERITNLLSTVNLIWIMPAEGSCISHVSQL